MNLEKSINNLSKRIERFDSPFYNGNGNGKGNGRNYWKGRKIVPIEEWHKIAHCNEAFSSGKEHLRMKEALQYFPDDYYSRSPFIFGVPEEFEDKASKWYSDYLELMGYRRNPKYGRTKCFHCLLSPNGDDPIFIGINRLVAKGLTDGETFKKIFDMGIKKGTQKRVI